MHAIRFFVVTLQPISKNAGGKLPSKAVGNRDVAQLVAHYVRDVGVGRSSRLIPTTERYN